MGADMSRIAKGRLLFHTVRQLKPVQIKHQILNHIRGRQRKRKKYALTHHINKVQIMIPELDEDEAYLSRFDVRQLMEDDILLLHEKHRLSSAWKELSASHLWNYNLHYLEFLVPLAVAYKQTGDESYKRKWMQDVASWIVASEESRDAYEAYTISLRIPNILIGMELLGEIDSALKQSIYESIYNQYKNLLRNQERALLANHFFENIKTIVISSVVFQEWNVYQKYFRLFLEQIAEQILPDGLHYERSFMYHKIILEDILRVIKVLQSSGRSHDAKKLIQTVRRMVGAMERLEYGFDRTPLFNDAGNNVSKSCQALRKASAKYCKEKEIKIEIRNGFPDSGYYRFDQGACAVLFDCGDIGPKYMGGHSHNDCLSFELSIGGCMCFVNSGTGQYQGELRTFFRSTAAHNTLMIDDREQSELWGEHRAARRICQIKAIQTDTVLIGQFTSYYGDVFRRRLQWKGRCLYIQDRVVCSDHRRHMVRQFFHLAPGYVFREDKKREDKKAVLKVQDGKKEVAIIRIPRGSDFRIHTDGVMSVYASDFGKYEHKQVLEVRTPFEKDIKIGIRIQILGAENG